MAAKAKSPRRNEFASSLALKSLFNEEYEKWRKIHRLSLDALGERCGLTGSYLSQIGRYGRIPSRSALVLLALNFDLKDPQKIFEAAGVSESWPFEKGLGLRKGGQDEGGFLSLRLDMEGLSEAIREVIRSEVKPRALRELMGGRPLRVGYSPLKHWMFKTLHPKAGERIEGLFADFVEMLAISLHTRVEARVVEYSDYPSLFLRDELDIFGPIVVAPNLPAGTAFTHPLYRVGMSALYRKRKTSDLADLPVPKHARDLLDRKYELAVIRHSRSHLLCNTRFKRADADLIICHSAEEALERITMNSIKRPAHVFVCNSVDAKIWHKQMPRDTIELFTESNNLLDFADSGVAVRADWPELVQAINEFIGFVQSTGSLQESFSRWAPAGMTGLLEPVTQ